MLGWITQTKEPFSLVLLRTIGHFALLLLLVDLLVVERQLLVLQNVAVSTTALTRTRRDASQDLTRSQLIDPAPEGNPAASAASQGSTCSRPPACSDRPSSPRPWLRSCTSSASRTRPWRGSHRSKQCSPSQWCSYAPIRCWKRCTQHQLVVGSVVHNVQDLGLGRESYKSLH